MDSIDDTSIISLYIKRFREQPPSSSEQRKILIDQNTKRKFWWQSECKEDLKSSVGTAISELSLSRIMEHESSVKDSQYSIFDDSQVNLDEYTNKLLNKCDKLLKEYKIESNTSIDNEFNNSEFEDDLISSSSSYVDGSHSSNSSIRSSSNSVKVEIQVNYNITENSNNLEYDNSSPMGFQSFNLNHSKDNFVEEESFKLELSKNDSIRILPSQLMIAPQFEQILDVPKLHLEYNDNISNSSMYLSPPYSTGQSPQNSIGEKDLSEKIVSNSSQTINIDTVKSNVFNNRMMVDFDVMKGIQKNPKELQDDDSLFTNESSLYGIEITNNNEELVDESYIEAPSHIDLDLIGPYMGDDVIYYMWSRLCTIKTQIATLEIF